MSSTKKLLHDIERLVSERGPIRGRNPVSTICTNLELNNSRGMVQVVDAIAKLHKEGKLTVRKNTYGKIESIDPVESEFVDRTKISPQSNREMTHTDDTPSTLHDDQCEPATVWSIKLGSAVDDVVPDTTEQWFTYDSSRPYHETLSDCLQVLRLAADESGIAKDTGVMRTLMAIDGMTSSAALRAMDYLRRLGLYTTKMTDYASSSYKVNTSLEAVTAEMLASLKAQGKKIKKSKPTAPKQPDATEDSGISQLEQLIALVSQLEGQLSQRDEALVVLDAELSETKSKLLKAQAKARDLHQRISTLETQLNAKHQPDPRVAEILKRHGLTS